MDRRHAPTVDRGQSGTIGVVLLLAMTITGATVAVALGAIALSGAQDQAQLDLIEQGMTQVDSRAALVALGEASAQTVELPSTRSGQIEIDRSAWIRVQIINTSTGNVETTVLNRSIGTIVYEYQNTTIAYQSGGVWRGEGNGSVMVSKPEFSYRDGTLTLRVINVTGSGGTNEVTIRDGGEDTVQFPNASQDRFNPVEDKKVRITIHSAYYQAWGAYFEERTDAGVDYDHADTVVNLTLLNPSSNTRITNALVINGGDGTLQIQSGQNSVVNSYNSSAIPSTLGPSTPPSPSGDADIRTTKDIEFSGQAQVTGNLTTSGEVTDDWSGSPGPPYRIEGYLRYGEGSVSSDNCNKYVREWCAPNASIESREPITSEIQEKINTIESSNDNGDESCFSESTAVDFSTCGSTVELGAGDYYTTQNLQVSGQKLLLNTTEGDIRIAVDGSKNIQFQSGANVTVIGNGTVRIYGTKQYQVQGGSTFIWNRGWDAPQLWMYCSADCQVQIQSSPTFVGVIYAPSKPGMGNAQVQIDGGNTEIYGAIVGGGDSQLQSNADIHFDRAVTGRSPFERSPLSSISYLHVSINKVNVTAG